MKTSGAKDVGSRIANERKALGLTQEQLAERISISRGRLASYEDGRGCLRCGIAFDICRNLVISERWLATGEGDKDLHLDVALLFPEELINKPFLQLYTHEIDSRYQQKAEKSKGEMRFLWRRTDHPETLKLACFKFLVINSQRIQDDLSRMTFWADVAGFARNKADVLSIPPRERLKKLDAEILILKDGKSIPFSYEQFYDDLSLIGVEWIDIEGIVQEIDFRFFKTKHAIPVEDLKNLVYENLQSIDLERDENFSEIYKKIYLWEK